MTVPVTKQNNNATMNHRAVMLSRRGSVVERSWTPKWRGMAADPTREQVCLTWSRGCNDAE